jgi:hypothetical protein
VRKRTSSQPCYYSMRVPYSIFHTAQIQASLGRLLHGAVMSRLLLCSTQLASITQRRRTLEHYCESVMHSTPARRPGLFPFSLFRSTLATSTPFSHLSRGVKTTKPTALSNFTHYGTNLPPVITRGVASPPSHVLVGAIEKMLVNDDDRCK